jgi:CRISPR/Cas system CMR-associated protein Cmr1 (group 7 of RAMP superfamily)
MPWFRVTSFDASWPVGHWAGMLNGPNTRCYGVHVKRMEEQKTECLYAYSMNGVRTHSKQYHHKHIYYTLVINRSNDTKYLEHPRTHRLGLLTVTENTQKHIDWDYYHY